MSWFKAVAYSDDVFDENADELVLINKEWTSNMKKRIRVKLMLANRFKCVVAVFYSKC